MEISQGNRYIIAGFCEYGTRNPKLTYEALYNPTYDGYAYQSGFRNGDIIVGLQVCEKHYSLSSVEGVDGISSDELSNQFEVRRKMVHIPPDMLAEEWMLAAQSCEILSPGDDTVMVVKRQIKRPN